MKKQLYNDKGKDFCYPFILTIKLLQKETSFWHDLFENDKNAYKIQITKINMHIEGHSTTTT